MVMKSSRRVKSVKKQRNVKRSRVSRKTSKSKVSKRKNSKTNRRKKRTKTKKKKHIMKGGRLFDNYENSLDNYKDLTYDYSLMKIDLELNIKQKEFEKINFPKIQNDIIIEPLTIILKKLKPIEYRTTVNIQTLKTELINLRERQYILSTNMYNPTQVPRQCAYYKPIQGQCNGFAKIQESSYCQKHECTYIGLDDIKCYGRKMSDKPRCEHHLKIDQIQKQETEKLKEFYDTYNIRLIKRAEMKIKELTLADEKLSNIETLKQTMTKLNIDKELLKFYKCKQLNKYNVNSFIDTIIITTKTNRGKESFELKIERNADIKSLLISPSNRNVKDKILSILKKIIKLKPAIESLSTSLK